MKTQKTLTQQLTILFTLLIFSTAMAQNTDVFESGRDKTPDMGFQGDYHKNNAGKIVFSKEKIDAATDGKGIINSFNVGDNIYGMVFMQTCVMNYKIYSEKKKKGIKNEKGGVQVFVYIDDAKQDYVIYNVNVSGDKSGRTFLGMPLNGKGPDSEWNDENFINSLNNLSNGAHKVRLELWGFHNEDHFEFKDEAFFTKSPIASGEFTITKGSGSSVKLGHSWNSVEAKMEDKDVEQRALKALTEYAKSKGWIETFSKIKITSEEWEILKHKNTGAIMSRLVNCACYAKWPDGHCTYQIFSFTQDYNGAGYQKTVKIYGVGNQSKIDCD